jgi:peptide/nickel transport system substrate-binding protein
MLHRRLTLAALGALALFGAGFAPPSAPPAEAAAPTVVSAAEGQPVEGDWLISHLEAEPATLNPITASDSYESSVNGYVYESLLTRDKDTLELKPELAESWSISADKLTYTFTLKQGVTFHDGRPFGARDVKFAFDTIKNPKIDAPHLRNYFQDVVSCDAKDDRTLVFRMNKPYFKALEMIGGIPAIPRHVFEQGDFNNHPNARHPIGTGPYRFVKWDTGREIVLERHPRYHGPKVHLSRIVFRIITDSTAALQVFKKGELDLMGVRPNQWVRELEPRTFQRPFNKAQYYLPNFSYIGWNERRPFFSDKRVRRAMTMLIDRPTLLEKLRFNLGKIVSGTFYINGPEYDQSIKPWPYDPVAARKLLDEAGWSDHDRDGLRDKDGRPFRFEFLISSGSQFAEQLATIVKEALAKEGIEMTIRKLEWAVFTEFLDERNYDAVTLGWSLAVEDDPYQIWHSSQADKGGSNHVGWKNAEADKLIEQGRTEFDKPKRVAMYRRLHAIQHDEQPYTFLFCSPSSVIFDGRFRNVLVHALGIDSREWSVPKSAQRYQTP